jgi:hypothetical protein
MTVVTKIRSPTIRGVECGPGPASTFMPDLWAASIGVSHTVLPVSASRAITTSWEALRNMVYSTLPEITADE